MFILEIMALKKNTGLINNKNHCQPACICTNHHGNKGKSEETSEILTSKALPLMIKNEVIRCQDFSHNIIWIGRRKVHTR